MNPQKNILITGGTGFAGSHLIETLLESGRNQIHTTTYNDVPQSMVDWLPPDNFHKIDLTNFDATKGLLRQIQPEQIYHLAGFASAGDSFEKGQSVLQNNINLQLNMLQSIREVSPKARMLSIGSADGYGVNISADELPIKEDHPFRPVNPYAVSKVSQELLAGTYERAYNLDIVHARPFNHIGERQEPHFAAPVFAEQIVKIERGLQDKVLVGNLNAVRDLSDVKDVVKAYITLMESGQTGEAYNIGSGQGITIQAMLDMMIALSEAEIKVEHDSSRDRPLDVPAVIANTEKIQQLGWQPQIALQQTLERVLNYWRNR